MERMKKMNTYLIFIICNCVGVSFCIQCCKLKMVLGHFFSSKHNDLNTIQPANYYYRNTLKIVFEKFMTFLRRTIWLV